MCRKKTLKEDSNLLPETVPETPPPPAAALTGPETDQLVQRAAAFMDMLLERSVAADQASRTVGLVFADYTAAEFQKGASQ